MAWAALAYEVSREFQTFTEAAPLGRVSWDSSHVINRPSKRAEGHDYTTPIKTPKTKPPKKEMPTMTDTKPDLRTMALTALLAELPHYRKLLQDLATAAGLDGTLAQPDPIGIPKLVLPHQMPPKPKTKPKPTEASEVVQAVIDAVTTKFGVKISTLIERDNKPENNRARALLYYLSHKLSGQGFSTIGALFDRTDSNISRANKQITENMKKDSALAALVKELTAQAKEKLKGA